MAKRLDEAPAGYEFLDPMADKEVVAVGRDFFELTPMVEGELELVWAELSSVIDAAMSKLVKGIANPKVVVRGKKNPKEPHHAEEKAQADSSFADFLLGIKDGLKALISDGRLSKILHIVLGEPLEYIQDNMTVKQALHVAGVLYKQNFNLDGLPEDFRKNWDGFLGILGFGGSSKEEEFVEFTLVELAKALTEKQSHQEAISNLREEALRLEYISVSSFTESTNALPTNADSPESTLEEGESESASLPENGADSDSMASVNVPNVASTPDTTDPNTPSGG